MRERPILFSGPMVRAILRGEKDVTRRLVKLPRWAVPGTLEQFDVDLDGASAERRSDGEYAPIPCPYGVPGDRLWVRETWRAEELEDGTDGVRYAADDAFIPIENTPEASARWSAAAYSKGKRRPVDQWRPSIFLPRWASRITLDVVDLRVERLHAITDADATREGVGGPAGGVIGTPRGCFQSVWDRINGKRSPWASDPWVWRVEFKVAEVRRG